MLSPFDRMDLPYYKLLVFKRESEAELEQEEIETVKMETEKFLESKGISFLI